MAAVSGALERAGAAPGGRFQLRARDDGRDQRPAGGARRAHRPDRHGGVHRRARAGAADAAAPLPAVRAAPSPLVPPSCVSERSSATPRARSLTPLDEAALGRLLDRLADAGGRVGRHLPAALLGAAGPRAARRGGGGRALPGVHVSASHDLLAVFREYERTSTTVIDAYLSPCWPDTSNRPQPRAGAGLPAPEIMRSNGGLTTPRGRPPRRLGRAVGPAAGRVGAARAGALSGSDRVLSFDMGGTSCDVAVIDDGVVRQSSEQEIGGPGAAAADGRRSHRRARAAAASPGRTPAAPCASGHGPPARCRARRPTDAAAVSRPSRTRTCCSDTSTPRRRWPAASASIRRLPARGRDPGRRSSAWTPRDRGRDRARGGRGDAARAARRDGRARRRPARLRAGRVRRRRPDARRAAGRAAGHAARALPARGGVAVGTRARDGRPAPRHRAQPAPGRGGDRAGTDRRRDARPRRRGPRRHAGRAPRGPLRPALPRASPSSWR